MGSEARARLGLAGLLLATLLSFGLVFAGTGYRGPALLGGGIAWALVWLLRRMGAGTVATLVVSTLSLPAYVAVMFFPDQTLYGLPTPQALGAAVRAIERAYGMSSIDYAPVPLRGGYVILIAAGVWVAVTLGELATFRWRRPVVATLVPIVMFSLALITGLRGGSGLLMLLFLSALLVYWGLEAANRARSWGRWVPVWPGRRDAETSPIIGALARRMGASCLAAAIAAPLFLPALEQGLLSWRSGSGEEGLGLPSSGIVDPFISIIPGLLEQSDEELFRVVSSRQSYWRIQTLSSFNGQYWSPGTAPTDAVEGGEIDAPTIEEDLSPDANHVEQRFTITGLRGDYLPAAERPARFLMAEEWQHRQDDLRSDLETADVGLYGGLVDGLTYSVASVQPKVSFRQLRRADVPQDGLPDDYFEEPAPPWDLTREAKRLLKSWTIEASTPFEKLVAIQNHLGDSPEFTYDETVSTSVSAESYDVSDFLTETKSGYCQQYATAFAVLARRLGYPSRVAVGFLPGQQSPAETGLYIVKGTHAHAWPEVFFEDIGWVPFEPTPRDEVTPLRHTLAPALAGLGRGGGAAPDGGGITSKAANPERVVGGPVNPLAGEQFDLEVPTDPVREWQRRSARIALVSLFATVLFFLSMPLIKGFRIRRRYRRARGPGQTVEAAFAEFEDEAADLAAARTPSESAAAYAVRLATPGGVPRQQALRLAELHEAAQYSSSGVAPAGAQEARRLVRALRISLWKSASWNARLRVFSARGLDWSPLWLRLRARLLPARELLLRVGPRGLLRRAAAR